MSILLVIFGLFSGCLLAVLVGLVGRDRNIGFGLAFILSLIFTPLVGLILTLLSAPKGYSANRSVGCLGSLLGIVTLFIIIIVALAAFGSFIFLA